MRKLISLLFCICLLLGAAQAQNPNFSAYFSVSQFLGSDGNLYVQGQAQVTGVDSNADFIFGQTYPSCTLAPWAAVTPDTSRVRGTVVGLYHVINYVHTGAPVLVPPDGTEIELDMNVEVDGHCLGTTSNYKYPGAIFGNWYSFPWGNSTVGYSWLYFAPAEVRPAPPIIATCYTADYCPISEGGWPVPVAANFVDFAQWVTEKIRIAVEFTRYTGTPLTQCEDMDGKLICTYPDPSFQPWCNPEDMPALLNVTSVFGMDTPFNDPSRPWQYANFLTACFRYYNTSRWTCFPRVSHP